ncbi:MAG: metallophosphoesterase [Candidatus Binatia bacterium]|nr:metallophosphoesterase [Candidatus Binatia bacterium]
MKILLVADLHYTLKQFDWLHAVAPDFDVVVLAGDHLDIVSTVPLQGQLVVVLNHLKRLHEHTRLVVSSGNHDLNGRNEAGEKVARWMSQVRHAGIPTDGDCLELDGALVSVCAWWDGPSSREEVGAQLARDAARRTGPWVWVYHAPPSDSPTSWAGTKHFGDDSLIEWIQEHSPDVVLCGHIHQSPFRKGGSWVDRIGSTWVFNAGKQIGPVPCHIVFDTEDGSATWHSLAGSEIVDLVGPNATATPRELPY